MLTCVDAKVSYLWGWVATPAAADAPGKVVKVAPVSKARAGCRSMGMAKAQGQAYVRDKAQWQYLELVQFHALLLGLPVFLSSVSAPVPQA